MKHLPPGMGVVVWDVWAVEDDDVVTVCVITEN